MIARPPANDFHTDRPDRPHHRHRLLDIRLETVRRPIFDESVFLRFFCFLRKAPYISIDSVSTIALFTMLLDLLTLGLWSKLARLTHYAFDAVLVSAILAGVKRSTGLTFQADQIGSDENDAFRKFTYKYLGMGEWIMDQTVAIAGSSKWFKRTR
ncbi:hypothetical protein QBC40DRAFT_289874 [Triangularia verruculosa]|uniref:DUF1748-domain-containing protein n=1 Tax=Triangularia verruculosa TaxID=2587418 RepID=A0AAN7AQN6_9PEZI|nr:hypothetical protein QBC40DRAFT_289874 [Triangularia verruculosa]